MRCVRWSEPFPNRILSWFHLQGMMWCQINLNLSMSWWENSSKNTHDHGRENIWKEEITLISLPSLPKDIIIQSDASKKSKRSETQLYCLFFNTTIELVIFMIHSVLRNFCIFIPSTIFQVIINTIILDKRSTVYKQEYLTSSRISSIWK